MDVPDQPHPRAGRHRSRPDTRIGDLADHLGLTSRTIQTVISDLENSGYLTRTRTGRRTHYTLHPHQPINEVPGSVPIGALLTMLNQPARH